MFSVIIDNIVIIIKQNIYGISYDQYFFLSYYVVGIGFKIIVLLYGGINISVLWSFKDLLQFVVNEWKFVIVNIIIFEKYDVCGCKFVIIFNKLI